MENEARADLPDSSNSNFSNKVLFMVAAYPAGKKKWTYECMYVHKYRYWLNYFVRNAIWVWLLYAYQICFVYYNNWHRL